MSIANTDTAVSESGLDAQIKELKRRISGRLKQGIYENMLRCGLRRDLKQPQEKAEAKIPIAVRPLAETDLDILLPANADYSPAEKHEVACRRGFYRYVPHGCFVAVDLRNNTPCYMQWLLGAGDNDLLARFKCFPRLKNNEALLEQAYTPPSHRGLGVMSAAMAMIAERGADLGARYVYTFVEEKNIASMKGCWRAGFQPEMSHRRIQIGFGVFVVNRFKELSENDPRRTQGF